jgi:cytochrome c553
MRYPLVWCVLAVPAIAWARHFEEFSAPPTFALTARSIGGTKPARATAPYQTSSRIAAAGDGALAIDADSGALIRTDASGTGVAQLAIGSDAGLLAYDPIAHRAYVADRRGDRIVVVDVDDAHAELREAAAWATPAEPYGVALTPDRATVLVTAIADRVVVAYDAANGHEKWRAAVSAEPRGIATSADGRRATVASLASGAVDEIALDTPIDRELARAPAVHHIALPVAQPAQHARGAFAVTYLGDRVALTAFQLEVPVATVPQEEGHYGGGSSFTPPITHHLAFLGADGARALAATSVQEPRAVAWDGASDRAFVAGMANDIVISIDRASQLDAGAGTGAYLGKRCGADGLAITPTGDLLVWCSMSRDIARVAHDTMAVKRGPELVASSLDAQHHEGFVLFHTADANISAFGAMSCGNCHLDGRADGLSWHIKGENLQTPMLAGRLADTAPFKWDGTAKDLPSSLRQTVERLGGSGLSKRHIASLTAFLSATPPLRAPHREPEAVARGKQLFESAEVGCTMCHDGGAYTDRERHKLAAKKDFDTPSLRGLAASAPYFHDGSAPTLEAVVRDRGGVHGMADSATQLDDRQIADLTAFLETL